MTTSAPLVRNADETENRWFYGGGVHTFTFTAYGETAGQVQVVGQALSR